MLTREVSEKTRREYESALRRAFGGASGFGDVGAPVPLTPEVWEVMNEPSRAMLRAALKWADPVNGQALAETIPVQKRVKRKKKYPSSDEIKKFTAAVERLPSSDGLVLRIMLKLGTRTEELLALSRAAIEEALRRGVVMLVRKGGVENELPVKHIGRELRALLKLPAVIDGQPVAWLYVYQLISATTLTAAHRRLNRIIKRLAAKTGLPSNWHPHMLRHAFATELIRDGATLPVVQRALGHSSYQTTVRNYVHVDTGDLEKWLKEE